MATITAASLALSVVQAAHDSCSDGDTLVLPSGTGDWDAAFNWTKAIDIQGAGIGSTIILDSVLAFQVPLIRGTLVAGKTSHLSGIEFRNGSGVFNSGRIEINGTSRTNGSRIRIHHCKTVSLVGSAFSFIGAFGVVDHCTVIFGRQVGFAEVQDSGYGDASMSAADDFGTDEFIFFEDNVLTCTWSTRLTMVDGLRGGRYVARRNVVFNGSWEGHGTEGSRIRGMRGGEIYSNTMTGNDTSNIVSYHRGGVWLIYGNTITGMLGNARPFYLLSNRNDLLGGPFSLGNAEAQGADGHNPWDKNVAGGPFYSGTASAFTNDSQNSTLTVSGAPWTTNQYAAYSITKTSGKVVSSVTSFAGTATVTCAGHGFSTGDIVSLQGATQPQYNDTRPVTVLDADRFTFAMSFGAAPATPATGTIIAMKGQHHAEISANTANTLTFDTSAQGSGYWMIFAPGDTFQIWRVDHAWEQPGRAGGSLITGDIPALPPGGNDQVTSACYEWSNTTNGSLVSGFNPIHRTIRSGEHFFDNTPKPGYTAYQYPHGLVSGVTPVGTDSSLSALTPGSGSLSPSFASGTHAYTMSVANGVTTITMAATSTDSTASSTINGTFYGRGVASDPIALSVGANVITIICTAQDGLTQTTYTVTVTRAGGASTDATLVSLVPGAGTLVPDFDSAITSYTESLPNSFGASPPSFRFVPTASDASGATITVNGAACASGAHSQYLFPAVGANVYTIVVTAADGATTKTYTVTATRAGSTSSDATLSGLTCSAGAIAPTFSGSTYAYSITVGNTTSSISVTPTAADPIAVITVNGSIALSGLASAPISLSPGVNLVTISVRAQDGVTILNYALTVTRPVSSDSSLTGMVVSGITLVPVFAYGTTSYTARTGNASLSATVTPTATNGFANITVNGVAVPSGTASGDIPLAVGVNIVTVVVTAQDGS